VWGVGQNGDSGGGDEKKNSFEQFGTDGPHGGPGAVGEQEKTELGVSVPISFAGQRGVREQNRRTRHKREPFRGTARKFLAKKSKGNSWGNTKKEGGKGGGEGVAFSGNSRGRTKKTKGDGGNRRGGTSEETKKNAMRKGKRA